MILNLIAGLKIVEDISMVDCIEDWSKVRSPGRARRRRAKHKQKIKVRFKPREHAYQFGDTLVMHPAMAARLHSEIELHP